MASAAIQRFIKEFPTVDTDAIALETLDQWRKESEELMLGICPPAGDVGRRPEVLAGVDGWWFDPPEVAPETVLLYLHGGGLISSSPRAHAGMIGGVARASRRLTFAPDYRLAPEHPFPAQRDDVIAVYRELLTRGSKAIGLRSLVIPPEAAWRWCWRWQFAIWDCPHRWAWRRCHRGPTSRTPVSPLGRCTTRCAHQRCCKRWHNMPPVALT